MIRIEHLKKTYINKNKEESRGLIDVSFTLRSKGFVFVLGKSGSGKSTLLNLLGSLDSKTSGKIYIEDKDLDEFNKNELSLYRSSYCGFIFQDYELINELTVFENIKLGLDIIGEENEVKQKVLEIIKKVELEGLENRNVNELSGGQKQRVAIARALIKNPKLILCDEPTGNLDALTSQKILTLLKEISKNCLVFMVSHDEKSSLLYADRRIILKEGKVVKDEFRDESYKNEFKIENQIAYLPFRKDLTRGEKDLLNTSIKNRSVLKVKQLCDGFIPFVNKIETSEELNLKNVELNKKSKKNLAKTYLNKGKVFSLFNVLLFSLLAILLILIQTLLSFDSNKIFLDNFNSNERNQFLISKVNPEGSNNLGTFMLFDKEDESNLLNGYSGEKYLVNNYCLSYCYNKSNALEGGNVLHRDNYFNQHYVYSGTTCGTALVTKEYLTNKYKDENGELIVLAGSIDDSLNSTKLIITDYIADSIIDSYSDVNSDISYSDLIGKIKMYSDSEFKMSNLCSAEVGCIIKTDYKNKYKKVFDAYEEIKNSNFDIEKISELLLSNEFNKYRNDVLNGEITLAYSLNPNFLNDVKENITQVRQYADLYGIFTSTCLEIVEGSFQFDGGYFFINNSLKDDEIILSEGRREQYLALFGEEYIGKELYFIKKDGNTNEGRIIDSISLKVVGCYKSGSFVNLNVAKKLLSMQLFNYAYLVPYTESSEIILTNALNSSFTIIDSNNEIYTLVAKTTNLFGDIFKMLEIIVIVILVSYFLIYSLKAIKDKSYQIGVFKSLGMKDKDITFIFLIKNVIFALLTIILTSILAYPFFKLANVLIIKAYSSFTSYLLNSINIFYFHLDIFLIVYTCIALFFIVFTLIPLIVYKRISPAKIVNNKSE